MKAIRKIDEYTGEYSYYISDGQSRRWVSLGALFSIQGWWCFVTELWREELDRSLIIEEVNL